MISFVVIGLNEGWKLIKCLDAIYHAIKYNQINNYDVIYIDSNSADNSIEFAKKYIDVKIFRIIGECNPAIARNIGAKEAKGDILFFIDGDMEIQPEFLKKVINESGQLKYDCVTGHVDDLFYGTKKNIICRRPRTYKDKLHEKEQILEAAGGIFIIKKLHWQKVHGMKTKYRVNEDMDLTLRLSRHGIKTIRIPHLICLHHTIDYLNNVRMWNHVSSGYELYPGMLLRDHVLNYKLLYLTLRNSYTSILFLAMLLIKIINQKMFIFVSTVYITALLLRALMNTLKAVISEKSKFTYYAERFVFLVIRDIVFWIGFFFFWPKEKKICYKSIN